jgi:hypothetical protein
MANTQTKPARPKRYGKFIFCKGSIASGPRFSMEYLTQVAQFVLENHDDDLLECERETCRHFANGLHCCNDRMIRITNTFGHLMS